MRLARTLILVSLFAAVTLITADFLGIVAIGEPCWLRAVAWCFACAVIASGDEILDSGHPIIAGLVVVAGFALVWAWVHGDITPFPLDLPPLR